MGWSDESPSVEMAKEGLTLPEMERLKFAFEQGESAYVKVKRHDGFYVGVHVDQLPHLEIVASEGRWAVARKRNEEA